MLRLLVLLAAVALARPAFADGGYLSGFKGARAAGRAGAFAAKADDLSAVGLNPAGLALIDTTLIQIGNRFSYNASAFTRAPTLDWGNPEGGVPPYVEFAQVENQEPWQLLEPLLGIASKLGLEDMGFALAIYAPAGIGRLAFPIDGGQRYMMVERHARILDYTASAAWKLGDVFGVGASLQWIHVPLLRYALVIDGNPFPGDVHPVTSELDMLTTVTGSDPFTFNVVAGAWYRPLPSLTLALSAQLIPTAIHTRSTLQVEPLSPEIDEQVELRRDGEPRDDVRLSLPLPLSARAAIRYAHRELFDVELDVVYESWSRVERFELDTDGLVANLLAQRVDLGSIAIDKRWRDTIGVHLGGDRVLVPELLTLRGGLFYESAVADRPYAHVDFVSGEQLGATLGASVFVLGAELAVAYELRRQPTVVVSEGEAQVFQTTPGSQCVEPFTDPDRCHPQFLGRPGAPVNAGSYEAHTHALSVDVLYRF